MHTKYSVKWNTYLEEALQVRDPKLKLHELDGKSTLACVCWGQERRSLEGGWNGRNREAEVSQDQKGREDIWAPHCPVLCFILLWSPALLCVSMTSNSSSLVKAGLLEPSNRQTPYPLLGGAADGLPFCKWHKAESTFGACPKHPAEHGGLGQSLLLWLGPRVSSPSPEKCSCLLREPMPWDLITYSLPMSLVQRSLEIQFCHPWRLRNNELRGSRGDVSSEDDIFDSVSRGRCSLQLLIETLSCFPLEWCAMRVFLKCSLWEVSFTLWCDKESENP